MSGGVVVISAVSLVVGSVTSEVDGAAGDVSVTAGVVRSPPPSIQPAKRAHIAARHTASAAKDVRRFMNTDLFFIIFFTRRFSWV